MIKTILKWNEGGVKLWADWCMLGSSTVLHILIVISNDGLNDRKKCSYMTARCVALLVKPFVEKNAA